jgi:hypothetical protein
MSVSLSDDPLIITERGGWWLVVGGATVKICTEAEANQGWQWAPYHQQLPLLVGLEYGK